jgi:lipoprotein signal peptidase
MPHRSFRGLLWILVLVGVTLDQASKYGVFAWLYNEGRGGRYSVVPGVFELLAEFTTDREPAPYDPLRKLQTLSGERLPRVNPGALFGLRLWFDGDSVWVANAIFSVVSVLAAMAIAYWSARPATARDPFLCAALGLILGGTLGNLYDRLIFHGVRDFLHFYWFEFPVFNIADSCLVCGAFLLLVQAFLSHPASASRPQESEPALSEAASVGR